MVVKQVQIQGLEKMEPICEDIAQNKSPEAVTAMGPWSLPGKIEENKGICDILGSEGFTVILRAIILLTFLSVVME